MSLPHVDGERDSEGGSSLAQTEWGERERSPQLSI